VIRNRWKYQNPNLETRNLYPLSTVFGGEPKILI
jgi:hypothetical protein